MQDSAGAALAATVRHTAQVVLGHTLAQPVLWVGSTAWLWVCNSKLLPICAVIVATNASTAIGALLWARTARPRVERPPGRGDSDQVKLTLPFVHHLLCLATEESGEEISVIRNSANQLRLALAMQGDGPADFHLELLIPTDSARALRLLYSERLPAEAYSRRYAIPGRTPGNGSSVAGCAWITDTAIVEKHASMGRQVQRFPDGADRLTGLPETLACVPVKRLKRAGKRGRAVVAVLSSHPDAISASHEEIIRLWTVALSGYYARRSHRYAGLN